MGQVFSPEANSNRIIHDRFVTINLPNALKRQICTDVQRWTTSNGVEWVVKRIKYIKQCLINYLTQDLTPYYDPEIWIKRKPNGFFKGPWGALFKWVKSRPKEVLKLIQLFTVFSHDSEPTEEMIAKFKSDVEKPFTGDRIALQNLTLGLVKRSKKILDKYLGLRGVHNQVLKKPGLYMCQSRLNNARHKTDIWWTLQDFFSDQSIYNVLRPKEWVWESFSLSDEGIETLKPPDKSLLAKLFPNMRIKPYSIGYVDWIMEPGLKERIVTDIRKPLEHLTMPLGKRLYDILKVVPWDSTFHEERGYMQIQLSLRERKTCYCFDLSKATDRFPYELQRAVMLSVCNSELFSDMLELVDIAANGTATLPNGKPVNWSVGQPMGFYPSFAMFSLTHGMVLMDYLYTHGIEYNNQFVVHGDDLVIMDDKLADWYINTFIPAIGVECNKQKCITSNNYAEFNSKLIMKDRIIEMRKWRPITPSSIEDALDYWGPKAIDWLPYKSNKKIDQVRAILSIPGIGRPNGINPKGIPLRERIESVPSEVRELMNTKLARRNNFVSLRHIVLSRFRNNTFFKNCGTWNDQEDYSNSNFAQYVVLPNLLGALDYADTLDRENLSDCVNFVDFVGSKDLVTHLGLKNPLDDALPADIVFDIVGHLLTEYNNVMHQGENAVTFNYFRQLTEPKSSQIKFSTRLEKALKCWKKIDRERE